MESKKERNIIRFHKYPSKKIHNTTEMAPVSVARSEDHNIWTTFDMLGFLGCNREK